MKNKYTELIDKEIRPYLVFIVSTINFYILIFGRAGQELTIFGFRFGELFIAFAFLLTLYLLFTDTPKIYKLFVVYNLVLLIINFSYPLSFRLSSYVWAFSYFFIFKEIFLNKKFLKILYFLLTFQQLLFLISYQSNNFLLWLYEIFGVGIYFKPSQQAVVLIFYIALIRRLKIKFEYIYLLLICLNLNLVIVSSRGATIGIFFAIYFLFKNSITNREKIFLLKIIIFSFLLFIVSFLLVNILNKNLSVLNYADLNEFTQLADVDYSESVEKEYKLSSNDEILKFKTQCTSDIFPTNLSFGDGNINWRYGILVDTLNCVTSSVQSIFFGFQYFEVMTPMIIEERDGLHREIAFRGYPNYSPHNILLVVLYYGGIINLVLFTLLVVKINKKISNSISPTLVVFVIGSLFGVVFESVTQIIFWQLILYEKSLSTLK